MSRLDTLSDHAIEELLAPESSDDLVTLMVLTGGGLDGPLYVTDTAAVRLSETPHEISYGIVSNGVSYLYVPMEVVLPGDADEGEESASIKLYDDTRQLLPLLRQAQGAINVDISLVMRSTPNVVEVEFPGLTFHGFEYDESNVITCALGRPGDETEPIPQHLFTPAFFPGGY